MLGDFAMDESLSQFRSFVNSEFCGGFPKIFGRLPRMGMESRVLARIQNDLRRKRYKSVDIARVAKRSQGSVSEIINGKAGLPYDVIEAVAELRGEDPAEIVAEEHTEVRALRPEEAEFLRYARAWPVQTLMAILDFLRHFSPPESVEEQYRNAVTRLRKMAHDERQQAFAYLVLLSEGRLPKDVRAMLPADVDAEGGLLHGLSATDQRAVRALSARLRRTKKNTGS